MEDSRKKRVFNRIESFCKAMKKRDAITLLQRAWRCRCVRRKYSGRLPLKPGSMNVLSDQGRAELVKIHKLYTKLGNCEKESLIRLTLQQLKEHFITALDVYRSIIDLNSGKRLSPQMVFWLQFMRLVLPKLHRIALEIQTRQAHQARQAAVNPIVLWNCIWMTCEQLKKVRSVAKKKWKW